ncbi:MAG: hypothetical protein IJR54_08055 [Oscillibacter sp.]|nr:hypothetical protein [Oscillibacter sp.]
MDNPKRSGVRMRPLWTLAGAYLLYLSFQQARLFLAGGTETCTQDVICILSALLFAAVGAWTLRREWKYARAGEDASGDTEGARDHE